MRKSNMTNKKIGHGAVKEKTIDPKVSRKKRAEQIRNDWLFSKEILTMEQTYVLVMSVYVSAAPRILTA